MRSRSSFKNNKTMEMEKPVLKDEPHLSGAYIRSLVKQLSSSKSKDPMNMKSPNLAHGDRLPLDLAKHGECHSEVQQQQPPPRPSQSQPPKKQVRRRLHTSRPYQERLLNMAEARREIVTALKLHRASMKQANEQQQQQQRQHQLPSVPSALQTSPPTLEEPHQELIDSRRNVRTYPSNYTFSNYLPDPSFSRFVYPSSLAWAYPSIPHLSIDNLNLPLPNQPLGLNLNIQGFSDIDISFCNNHNKNPPIQSSPSPPPSSSHSYSYSSPSTVSGLKLPSVSNMPPCVSEVVSDPVSSILHPVMDDKEIAEIRSIGEQYDMEWNDTMNLVTSAWWSKFLKHMEESPNKRMRGLNEDGFHVFDEALDIPSWLNDGSVGDGKDNYLLQQQMDDYCHTKDYLKDVTLPWLDIGEIDGWDAEWLS
ncbi:uncharacterized protein LOC103705172 [Phoenix dactylifera]|uniref:Uncharacterized protein LOC103705172 n=1 Tax=Phoenix dactylifera TaxID=42345 RepID=A0A8B7BWV8_PHODC|nr:uncharacterized protein LOC103705172 [Phoenix dactylifera]